MEAIVDSNNNAAAGKYSLRPRTTPKRIPGSPDSVEEAKPRRKSKTSSHRSLPLSKYRRKSANARERSRMREINEAFAALRRVVGWGSDSEGEKVTKISTLRLAMRHITALSDALRDSGTSGTEPSAVAKNVQSRGQPVYSPLSTTPSSADYLVTLNSSLKADETSVSKVDENSLLVRRPSTSVHEFTSSHVNHLLTSSSSVLQKTEKAFSRNRSNDCCEMSCAITNRSHKLQRPVDIKVPLSSTASTAQLFNHDQNLRNSCTHRTSHPDNCLHLSQSEECSPLLSSVIDDLPLQPISFEELFIT